MVGADLQVNKNDSKDKTEPAKSGQNTITVSRLKKEVVQRLRSHDLEMPLLPRIATKIMKLSSDPDSTLTDFANLIKQDQFITGQVIQIANSPVYGGLCEVTNLTRAIAQIGIRTIKDLIIGISIGSSIFRNPKFQKEMDSLWKHSMAVAMLCQEIAVHKKLDSEHAFLCGLVHDIGKPFLVDVVSKLIRKEEHSVSISHDQLVLIINQLHQAVGGILARVWKFPETITQAVAHHHDFQSMEGDAKIMANIVYLADSIANNMDIGLKPYTCEISLEESFAGLNIPENEREMLMKALPDKVEQYLSSIGAG